MAQHSRTSATLSSASERVLRRVVDVGRRPPGADHLAIDSERLLALFAARDLEALVDAAFSALRASVTCEFVSAFYRSAGSGLLKERDSRGREYGLAFMRRYLELTPALPVALANPGIRILLTRRCLPRSAAELRRSAFYREVMQPQGWRHAVALCFWGDPPAESPVFVTSVYRSEQQSDFSDEEVAGLENIHPFLDCAVNRVLEHEMAEITLDGVDVALRDRTRGVALLDRNRRLVQANPAARELCGVWRDGAVTHAEASSGAWRLPPGLDAVCGELHHEWQSLMRAEPDATGVRRQRHVAHAHVPGLTASITICPSSTGLAEPAFVVEFDRRVYGMSVAGVDYSAAVLGKMTTAERAVAMIVADGLSNQEVADRLGKSVDAVKFLLHRIYQRTGIPSRAALVAILRSSSNGDGSYIRSGA